MRMTIDTIIKDCEQSINQNELFIKVHQTNMEIGEIKEYQYYIERDKLTIDTMRKYQQLQADYEARLKADMVAMLTEIQLDIEECVDGAEGSPQFEQGVTTARVQVVEIIQEKINDLKRVEE